MASDMFIKIGDIKGESHDDKHKDEIDILSWSWGVAQTGTFASGGGGGAGKASFHDLSFQHHVDKSSPVLAQACATGTHIKEAQLTVRKAGKGQQEYYIIKMNDILVSSVQSSGSESTASLPMESVSLNFAKIHFDYKPQKLDGTLEAAVTFKYDLKANKQL
jgi:type VI secretion system secreted protein Hcp